MTTALELVAVALVIAANDFKPAGESLHDILSEICREIRKPQ